MNTIKQHIAIVGIIFIMLSCNSYKEKPPVTVKADYIKLLRKNNNAKSYKLVKYNEEAGFWTEKLKDQPNGYLYLQKLATIKSTQFELTGDVNHLFASDSLFKHAASKVSGKAKASNLLSLSSNAIKKHQFQQALDYSLEAISMTDEKFGPWMMMYDAYMELGNYEYAGSIITQNKRLDNFHYLVRLSKYQDYKGNLDSAIVLMEKAYKMAEKENNETAIWAQANLGDMYGHAGRLEDSYNCYLQVLNKDPEYLHAWKGIAWIAYSNDGKVDEAKAILHFINKQTLLPDAHLLLAEIAAFSDRPIEKNVHHKIFVEEASKPKYLDMYNKYLITLHSEVYMNHEEAIALAKQEVNNRPTPLAYALLAWTYQQKGDYKQALKIINEHVEGMTFEPEAVYYMGMINAANGKVEKAKICLSQAAESSFELGPVTANIIRDKLNEL